MMTPEDAAKLSRLLGPMDLPAHRKHSFTHANLQWLARNMGIRNANHKNFQAATDAITEGLKPFERFAKAADEQLEATRKQQAADAKRYDTQGNQ